MSLDQEGAVSSNQDDVAGVDVCGPYAPDISQLSLATDQPGMLTIFSFIVICHLKNGSVV